MTVTPMATLDALKKFFEDHIASQVLLKKDFETEEITTPDELVHPIVEIQFLPPKNWLPPDDYIIPSITLMVDEGSDDYDSASVKIRAVFAVFSPGIKSIDPVSDEEIFTPDYQGYRDILNLIERTRQELLKASVIPNAGEVMKPFSWQMYAEEDTYPRYFAFATFGVSQVMIEPLNYPTL